VTFHLDNKSPGINMLGQSNVWVALEFASNETINFPEGVYVDDVVIRKCVGGTCPAAASADLEPSAAQVRKVQAVRIRPNRRLPAEQQPPK